MKICFIMYPWDKVSPKQDSTLRIIHELASRNHEVAITYPQNLTIRDSITLSLCRNIEITDKISSSIPSFYKNVVFKEEMMPLQDFDVIFMRDNPPMDPLVLNFLDSIKDDVFDDFNLFPNPSNGTFNLSFTTKDKNNVSVQLFDLSGRLIDSRNYNNTNAIFFRNISLNVKSGSLYLLKITNNNKYTTRKIIIK